jgi:menaquinone-9 beta-reductase
VPPIWDVIVVGSGPAGSAAAIAARQAAPAASVLLLDRKSFPRDKCCGDGVFDPAVTALEQYGVARHTLLDGYPSVRALRIVSAGGVSVSRPLAQSMTVIPRGVFDARLLDAARRSGAEWCRHTVREARVLSDRVELDGVHCARVVVGADGAESVLRRTIGPDRHDRCTAVAIRGYTRGAEDRTPLMVFDDRAGLAYAWRFPTTGSANVGYGHQLHATERASRRELLAGLNRLIPDLELDEVTLLAHRLPLSTSRASVGAGRVLLAGDAASLVNPISGEGIYYAIRSGLVAGTIAGQAAGRDGTRAATDYRRCLGRIFGRHQRHVAVMSYLTRSAAVLEAGLRAATLSQRTFDDIASLGLAEGVITPRLMRQLTFQLLRRPRPPEPVVAS